VGTPDVSDLTLSSGAGYGEKGDALNLGPAQERLTPLAAQPKPTHAEKPANPETAVCAAEPSTVIALMARSKKAKTANVTADTRAAAGLVTVRPKPEKRKNAKERAKEKAKDKPEATEVAAVNPEAVGLATAHPKPEKRKNAKERAKEKYTKDRTTPDTTAKAKSKVDSKAKSKSKAKTSKAAAKAA
jgi:hypothetical protein